MAEMEIPKAEIMREIADEVNWQKQHKALYLAQTIVENAIYPKIEEKALNGQYVVFIPITENTEVDDNIMLILREQGFEIYYSTSDPNYTGRSFRINWEGNKNKKGRK